MMQPIISYQELTELHGHCQNNINLLIKNLMKKIILICFIAFLYQVSCSSQNNGHFVSLFNGKDLSNWALEKPGGFEGVDGELITRSFGSGNDIYTNKWYGNFILHLEFMLSEVGNSGVFIRSKPSAPDEKIEVQLLAPWTPWRDDLHCTGSIYGHVAVTNRPDETPGVWYKMEIKCDRNIITISVNDKVTTLANTDTVKTMANKPFIGAIGFQGNHADKKDQFAKFRNIYIRDLDLEPDYVAKGFYEKNSQLRDLAHVAAVNIGAKILQQLAVLMSGDDPVAKSGSKQALFDIVAKASDPAVPKSEREEVAAALKKCIKNTSSEITKEYLKWLSGMII
jgi:hypothetical protein